MADIRITNVGPNVSSQFSELMTSSKTSIIELISTYGISDLRDIVVTTGTGTVSNDATEYILNTSAGADSAILDSAQRGRYEPGYACETGIAVRQPAAPVGNQIAQWGLYDDENGAFFGNSSSGFYVGIRRAGTDTIIPQASWNVDTLNGSGPSNEVLDLTEGFIFQIVFTWYGYGIVEFRVVVSDPVTLAQQVITVHRYDPAGQTSFTDPNLPLRAEVSNNGTAGNFDLYVGGRQYSIIGKFEPVYRNTSERRTLSNIPTTLVPAVSFTRKAEFPAGSGRANSVQVLFESAEIITNVDLAFQIIVGGTVNGTFAAYPTATTNIPNNETALLVNTTSTTITGGEVVFQGLAAAGSGTGTRVLTTELLLDTELPDDEIVTLAVARVSGSGTNTVTAMFRVTENW